MVTINRSHLITILKTVVVEEHNYCNHKYNLLASTIKNQLQWNLDKYLCFLFLVQPCNFIQQFLVGLHLEAVAELAVLGCLELTCCCVGSGPHTGTYPCTVTSGQPTAGFNILGGCTGTHSLNYIIMLNNNNSSKNLCAQGQLPWQLLRIDPQARLLEPTPFSSGVMYGKQLTKVDLFERKMSKQ